jgi:hypothetical protein
MSLGRLGLVDQPHIIKGWIAHYFALALETGR